MACCIRSVKVFISISDNRLTALSDGPSKQTFYPTYLFASVGDSIDDLGYRTLTFGLLRLTHQWLPLAPLTLRPTIIHKPIKGTNSSDVLHLFYFQHQGYKSLLVMCLKRDLRLMEFMKFTELRAVIQSTSEFQEYLEDINIL